MFDFQGTILNKELSKNTFKGGKSMDLHCVEKGVQLKVVFNEKGVKFFNILGFPEKTVVVAGKDKGCRSKRTIINGFFLGSSLNNEIGFYFEDDENILSFEIKE